MSARWMLFVTLFVALLPTLAFAGDFSVIQIPAAANGSVNFSTPSNNIECFYSPRSVGQAGELMCDRAEPVYLRFIMGERGKVGLIRNSGEQPCCSGNNPLPYGSAWQMPPFRCESTASGLTCERQDGHGFFISRSSTRIH